MFLETLAKREKSSDAFLAAENEKLMSQAQTQFKAFAEASTKQLTEQQGAFGDMFKSQSLEVSKFMKKQEDDLAAQRKAHDAHFETHNQQLTVVKNKMAGNEAELKKLVTMSR
eukprot:7014242-Pyramimonas_sp.AAC.2